MVQFRICCTSFWLSSKHKTILNIFIAIFAFYNKLFHLTDGYICCCARAFIRWMAELFTVFIDTNITILWIFFIFRCARSLLFALGIIRTWSFFVFIRAHSCYVDALQFLIFIAMLTCPIISLTFPNLFCYHPI